MLCSADDSGGGAIIALYSEQMRLYAYLCLRTQCCVPYDVWSVRLYSLPYGSFNPYSCIVHAIVKQFVCRLVVVVVMLLFCMANPADG